MQSEDSKANPSLRWTLIWVVLLAIPLVPFTIMMLSGTDPFLAWAESVRDHAAIAGAVCAFLLLTDVVLPIPSSFVAVVNGQALGMAGGGLLNWVAITAGHCVGYALARTWGRPLVERYVGAQQLNSAERTWRHGAATALILSRPVPVLAESLAMFAGLVGFTPLKFFAIAAIANLPHSFLYSWAGSNSSDLSTLTPLLAAGVGVPTVGYLSFIAWNRISGKAE